MGKAVDVSGHDKMKNLRQRSYRRARDQPLALTRTAESLDAGMYHQ
jgi:hypothetical protein